MQYFGTARLGAAQVVSYTGTAGTSTAMPPGVNRVRVVLTTAGYVKIGKSVTATATDVYMPADTPEYFTCAAGEVVSAIQLTSGGNLHVAEAL